jgi:hypothetical protein
MYQFSIMNFRDLFKKTMSSFYEKGIQKQYEQPDKKIDDMNKKLRYQVYK